MGAGAALDLLLVFLIASVSSFIHGYIGFGYSIIAMAVMPMFFSMVTSGAIGTMALLAVCCRIAYSLKSHINWRKIWIPTMFMVIGKILGTFLLMNMVAQVLESILGLILIFYSLNALLFRKSLGIKGTKLQGGLLGFLGGIMGGLYNMSGPAIAVYYMAVCKDDIKEYSACINCSFVPSTIVGMGMHLWYGNYTLPVIQMGLFSMLGVLIGVSAGIHFFQKADVTKVKRITYIFIGSMGVFMLCSSLIF